MQVMGVGMVVQVHFCLISMKFFDFFLLLNIILLNFLALYFFFLHLAETAALIHLEIIHHWRNVCA